MKHCFWGPRMFKPEIPEICEFVWSNRIFPEVFSAMAFRLVAPAFHMIQCQQIICCQLMSIVSCVRNVVCDNSSNGLFFDCVFEIFNILYVGYGKLFHSAIICRWQHCCNVIFLDSMEIVLMIVLCNMCVFEFLKTKDVLKLFIFIDDTNAM